MVEQHLRSLAREFRAEVDWAMFESLFRDRLEHDDIKVARALEANFTGSANPTGESEVEGRIGSLIEAHRRKTAESSERELFKQRRRLADARRSLEHKETKRAREEQRIAQAKIDLLLARLADFKRDEPLENDQRIFPLYFAPLVIEDAGRRLIRPMRYTCRLPGRTADYDSRFPGTYNARRDNLRGFWGELYGRRHGILAITSFFENVPLHLVERRNLGSGEEPKNVVLHFDPRPGAEMLVACLWARWSRAPRDAPDTRELHSFAAITDDPPPEIAATGHNRCVIPLKRSSVDEWLAPESVSRERLEEILSDREQLFYEHRIAA